MKPPFAPYPAPAYWLRIPSFSLSTTIFFIYGKPTPIGEEEKNSSHAERGLRLRKNTGLDTDNQAQGVDKKKDEVIVIDE